MSRIKPTRWVRELERLPEMAGWEIDRTGTNHYKFTHPDVSYPVFTSSTPGDRRTINNIRSELRRALRGGPRKGRKS